MSRLQLRDFSGDPRPGDDEDQDVVPYFPEPDVELNLDE
jgi:hypothetical protein